MYAEEFRHNYYFDSDLVEKYKDYFINGKYIELLEERFSYNDIFGTKESKVGTGKDMIRASLANWENSATTTATPFITKVVNHWFRNNYFTDIEEEDLGEIKSKIKSMLYRIAGILEDIDFDSLNEDSAKEELDKIETLKGKIDEIDGMSYEEIEEYIKELDDARKNKVLGQKIDGFDELEAEDQEQIENEIEAMKRQIEYGLTGSAYEVMASPAPTWYGLSQIMELNDEKTNTLDGLLGIEEEDSGESVVKNFLSKLTIKEKRSADIMQIHNPLFEDNSRYIRSWLKEKYFIFDGTTDNSDVTTSGGGNPNIETTGVALNSRIASEQRYINGKHALEAIEAEIERTTAARDNMEYLYRDLKQLFEDFEFDLENQETPATHIFDNIMPEYKPYSTWPSVYEKSELNSTKMIYKADSAELKAPANCIIDAVGEDYIQLLFTSDDAETIATTDMTLRVTLEVGSFSKKPAEGTVYERGDTIATVSSGTCTYNEGKGEEYEYECADMIILKLNLFTATKQIVRVEDYMEVQTREVLENEKQMLHDLLTSEFQGEKFADEEKTNKPGSERAFAYVATINTVLNRISSPYTLNSKDIKDVLDNAEENGYLRYREGIREKADIEELIEISINNAIMGVDFTKEYTLIGATGYYGGVKAETSTESNKEDKETEETEATEKAKATGETKYIELYYPRHRR